jgi:hypothetical protein
MQHALFDELTNAFVDESGIYASTHAFSYPNQYPGAASDRT